MRSYFSHLESLLGSSTQSTAKPIFRSSAIFPAIYQPNLISTRILYMGYWVLKRSIESMTAVVTLRSKNGDILSRKSSYIHEPQAFRIELTEYLERSHLSLQSPFMGSLEVEFYSSVPLVFPFPATVLNFYGPNFCTVVHTAQRVYNDFDDMRANSETSVPESGFNLYVDEDIEPFFCLINGGEAIPNCQLTMTFYNHLQETLEHTLEIGILSAYQTLMIYPARIVNGLNDFLGGKVGAAKIHFRVKWIFPRLIVGNIQKKSSLISITHTYYDCSSARTSKDYWKPQEEGWYPASLMIPLTLQNESFTRVYFYPIYSPSNFVIDVEIYDNRGNRIAFQSEALIIEKPSQQYQMIDFKKQFPHLPPQEMSARLIARTRDKGSLIPARIKLGLDLSGNPKFLPCNICTNLVPFNPGLETKPRTFRWLPLLADQPNATAWIMNSSPAISYQRNAELVVTFYREKDSQALIRHLSLPPQGFHMIQLKNDAELRSFFENKVGWLTVVSDTPHILTYYFAEQSSGMIGGDHGF